LGLDLSFLHRGNISLFWNLSAAILSSFLRVVIEIILIIKMEQRDTSFIDEMTKMIIRPHRDIYTIEKLGNIKATQDLFR
jgi:hypothetical protein